MPASDQNLQSTRYKLVPRTLIFITCGERVLLLKVKDKHGQSGWTGRYNGLGGHIERGEDVLSAGQRELLEESGLWATDLWLCGVVTIDTGGDTGIGLYILRGECPPGDLAASEEGKAEWFTRQELDKLVLVEDLPVLLPRILGMQRGEAPFSAHFSYDEEGQLRIRFCGET